MLPFSFQYMQVSSRYYGQLKRTHIKAVNNGLLEPKRPFVVNGKLIQMSAHDLTGKTKGHRTVYTGMQTVCPKLSHS